MAVNVAARRGAQARVTRRREQVVVAAVLVLGVIGLSACGGTTSSVSPSPSQSQVAPTSGSAAPSSPSAAPSSTSAAPHQTESNPAGDIPDQQVFVTYTPPGTHFSVKVPEGWARTETADGVTFTDKLNSITIQEVAATASPTEVALTSTVIPQLRGRVPAFAPGKVSTVTRKAGSAVLLTYLGDSAPDPVTNKVIRDAFERYSFWQAGHEAVLTLSGPQGADNVDPWKIVTDSVRWQ